MENKYDITDEVLRNWLDQNGSASEEEIRLAEDALIQLASSYALTPDADLKISTLEKIRSLRNSLQQAKPFDAESLPILDATANLYAWQGLVKDIQPPQAYDGIYLHPIDSNETRELFVAWVKEYVPEEVHSDIVESFLLLEGTCECHITNPQGETRVVRMSPGDYITMQVGETHDVIITSLQPAKAILQWLKLSA